VASLLLLAWAPAAGASGLVVQQIGEVRGRIAEAVAEEAVFAGVTIVPFSRHLDARTTPIMLATGKVFLARQGDRVLGLRPAERRAIRQAYEAGQAILLLDASAHDIEALHMLLEDGVAHESSTDPVVLAYALRRENHAPRARLVVHPPEEDELALSLALEIVIEELTRPPVATEDAPAAADFPDWGASPIQSTVLHLPSNGIYSTPVDIYALHSCQRNLDYYLVNTGGDWTATQAHYESAGDLDGTLKFENGNMEVDWQPNSANCAADLNIFVGDPRICRYMNYPLSYEVDIVPPSGPTVVQVNAAPAGDQGRSASYESGFSFSIGGGVEVSGDGPSGGIQAGVSWNNSVSTTVPPLVIEAGDTGNEGTFTRYKYCTLGETVVDCASAIQMTGVSGLCQNFMVGSPQNGQTPDGRLSNVAQTVNWQVDPGTYTGSTFDITVTWTVELATSTSRLWGGQTNPPGYCNLFNCSCGIDSTSTPMTVSQTFKVPIPSSSQCPS
jgi:hypothetical protein